MTTSPDVSAAPTSGVAAERTVGHAALLMLEILVLASLVTIYVRLRLLSVPWRASRTVESFGTLLVADES